MHAIIETGGKQFRVAPGDVVRVPKLAGDAGSDEITEGVFDLTLTLQGG